MKPAKPLPPPPLSVRGPASLTTELAEALATVDANASTFADLFDPHKPVTRNQLMIVLLRLGIAEVKRRAAAKGAA